MTAEFSHTSSTKMSTTIFRAAAMAALVATQTSHVMAAPTNGCTVLSGGDVTIEECATSFGGGTYSLTNNAQGISIHRFFVSTQATGGDTFAQAFRANWGAGWLSEGDFNQYYGATYGQFDSVFGLEDTGVFVFAAGTMGSPIETGATTGHVFRFGAPPTSEFLAIGSSTGGAEKTFRSFGTAVMVPEPGSLPLVALAALGLGLAARRRRGS